MINSKRLVMVAVIAIALLPLCLQAQEIRFQTNELSLREVFKQIENQTQYLISYPVQGIDLDKKLTFTSTSLELRKVMEQALEQTGFTSVSRGSHIVIIPNIRKEGKKEIPATPIVKESIVRIPQTSYEQLKPMADDYLRMELEKRDRELRARNTDNKMTLPEIYRKDSVNQKNRLSFMALRINLLYGFGTLTPNGGVEFGITPQSTLLMTGSYNAWRKSDADELNKKLWHWTIGAEYRYWLKERFKGHFLGGHAFYGQYNISGKKIPMLLEKGSENYRYEGYGTGAGFSYGYQMTLGKQWNLEFNAGIGAGILHYDKWGCGTCGTLIEKDASRFFVAPTHIGINIIYLIK